MYRADTIAACATPPGRGAVAIVRLSGPEALGITQRIFAPSNAGCLQPWTLRHGRIVDETTGDAVDEALVVFMPGPNSYTGEDVCEFQSHGSPIVVERILSIAFSAGARAAERGEFTRRAVLNGRIDLVQAEAVADIIDARTQGGAEVAWAQLQGALSDRLNLIREKLMSVLADIEANVDFSEDELPEENVESRTDLVDEAIATIDELVSGFVVGRRYREGTRVVLVGRPNVGKSSLINTLLGYGRMIVSDEPGTTRDTVEELIDIGGVAFVLTDTAGLRDTAGKAEAAAVVRARQSIEAADIVVAVVDGSVALTPEDGRILESLSTTQSLVVINKSDLPRVAMDESRLRTLSGPTFDVSALTGQGCEELVKELRRMAIQEIAGAHAPVTISRVRHLSALETAGERLEAVRELLVEDSNPELAAFEVRAALARLADIVAPLDNEELLDVIFKEFCIGK